MKNYAVLGGAAAQKNGVDAFLADRTLQFGAIIGYLHGKDQDKWLQTLRSEGRVQESATNDALFEKLKNHRIDGIFCQPAVYERYFRELSLDKTFVVQDWTPCRKGCVLRGDPGQTPVQLRRPRLLAGEGFRTEKERSVAHRLLQVFPTVGGGRHAGFLMGRQRSLSRVFLWNLLLTYLLISGLFVTGQVLIRAFFDRTQVMNSLENVAEISLPGIESAVWNLQLDQLQAVVGGMGVSTVLARVEVVSPQGRTLALWENGSPSSTSREVMVTKPIVHIANHRNLGTLVLVADTGAREVAFYGRLVQDLVFPLQLRQLLGGHGGYRISLGKTGISEISTFEQGFNSLLALRTQEIRDKEAQFRSIFENAGMGIAFVGADGRLVSCNTNFGLLLAEKPPSLIGKPWKDHFDQGDWALRGGWTPIGKRFGFTAPGPRSGPT